MLRIRILAPLLLVTLLATPAAGGAQALPLPPPDRSCVESAGSEPAAERAIRWQRDRATAEVLARWCAAVGTAVVRPAQRLDPGAAEERIDSLAILNWNSYLGVGDLERLVTDLRSGRLTEGRPVQHFVLLLQEAPRTGEPVPATLPPGAQVGRAFHDQNHPPERFEIVEMAERLGMALYYVPSMRHGPRQEDWGNAILSTLPLSALEAIELPFEARRRVAVAAEVSGTTSTGLFWQLRLASTHLDVWSRRGVLSTAGGGRLRQVRALVSALGRDGTPTVLGGDFNTWGFREPALPYLRQHFPASPTARGSTHTTGRRLDYLFFRLPGCGRARYHRLDDRYGSDHYPLLGWVSLSGCSPTVEPQES